MRFVVILLSVLFCAQSCRNNAPDELSGGYFVYSYAMLNSLPHHMSIYSKITSYDYNKDFIVAAQEPDFGGHLGGVMFDFNKNERVADSIINNDPYYQKIFAHKINYWIISNKDSVVYGPLTLEEYWQKKKELKVPDDLRLER